LALQPLRGRAYTPSRGGENRLVVAAERRPLAKPIAHATPAMQITAQPERRAPRDCFFFRDASGGGASAPAFDAVDSFPAAIR
jgi:hypothetical protein